VTAGREPSAVPIGELERRMRPGGFSQVGFLDQRERLEDVLAMDRQTMLGLGLDFARLAAGLDELLDAAESSPRRATRIGKLDVSVDLTTGFQICPWSPDPHRGQCTAGGGVRHASLTWKIRNRTTGDELRGPGLIVHLIRDHGFFEGRGSPSRVDPRRLAELLELD
jgi:hypothetical protein